MLVRSSICFTGLGLIDGYYFDKTIKKTSVKINNELAALYYYRTYVMMIYRSIGCA